ncbi:cupin-like domain-containing protein [Simiduia sp. 21SJ11W-1]|uniref:cupin-like domain-containing protein n=1 Tax=Simiduia sp. 21SJ11W-1 TaxID=2909669 RepID=UPI0020A0781B|nr:cupin-like domain-containing protein [Simiduia sp. 21SJ11W-1]UTA48360.1 cupin-like domain-containing protein [Simiduia sp. 21SJ11W-1]
MRAEVRELDGLALAEIPVQVVKASLPVVFRGAISHWPLDELGNAEGVQAFFQRFDSGRPIVSYRKPVAERPDFGYAEGCEALSFTKQPLSLGAFFEGAQAIAKGSAEQSIFAPSVHLDTHLPGLRSALCDELPYAPDALIQAWMGGPSLVPAHFDSQHNFACCVSGRRRFTLLEPEQLENLYVGPMDLTPAGQPISLVDPYAPDLAQHPRYASALQAAQSVELAPGDVLYIPPMWWHQVEGLAQFNLMINYWWPSLGAYTGDAMYALYHAMLTIKDLPDDERNAWRNLFKHYVFDAPSDGRFEHIPAAARGRLDKLDAARARTLRAQILRALNV